MFESRNPADRFVSSSLVVSAACSLACVVGGARAQCVFDETRTLVASDADTNDWFGWSTGLDGDVAVVGALYDGDRGDLAGAAYVLRFDGTAWQEEAKLIATDTAERDFFGYSVAVSGDVVLVSAPYNDHEGGTNAGAAYVFRYDRAAGVWRQEAKLVASDATPEEWLGQAAALSGDVVILGLWRDDDHGELSGSAYIFQYNNQTGEWVEEAKLTAPDAAAGDLFGARVATNGARIAVAAPGDDEVGSLHVYRRDGGVWSHEERLTAPDGKAGDIFGYVAAPFGDEVMVVGAFSDDTPAGVDAGSAHVYRFDGDSWVHEAQLFASNGAAGDRFGVGLSMSGNVAVIGAHLRIEDAVQTGGAWVFEFDGKSWVERATLTVSDAPTERLFGLSISLDGDTALVSGHKDDGSATNAGAVYVYHGLADRDGDGVLDACAEVCRGDVNGDGIIAFDDLLELLAGWGPCP